MQRIEIIKGAVDQAEHRIPESGGGRRAEDEIYTLSIDCLIIFQVIDHLHQGQRQVLLTVILFSQEGKPFQQPGIRSIACRIEKAFYLGH